VSQALAFCFSPEHFPPYPSSDDGKAGTDSDKVKHPEFFERRGCHGAGIAGRIIDVDSREDSQTMATAP
jgi:hypothetical protein